MSRFSTDLRRATEEDAEALAILMEIADRAHYPESGYALTLGGTREHQLGELAKLARASARSGFHYSHFEVATDDSGDVIACVAGFDKARADSQAFDALIEIGWSPGQIEASFERIAGIGACFPPDEPDDWTIEHVAVLPEFRGRGIARVLLNRVLANGSRLGSKQAVVDVFEGNLAARQLYINAGFTPVCVFGREEFARILHRDPLCRLAKSMTATNG